MSLGLDITVSVDGMPNDQLAQAGRVEVYERFGETTVFSIRYMEDIYEGDLNMLKEPAVSPGSVLSISANVNDSMECLIKGPAHHQQIHLQHGGEGSWMEVSGSDTSITLDREEKSVIWDNVTDGDAVTSILGNYGLTPDVATTNTRHLEAKHVLVQRETDFRFIRRLARRNGCYFWVSGDAMGLETGHFKRPELNGQTGADLVIN